MIIGRFAPPPDGYAVSNHWVKNWPSRASQLLLCTGSHWRKAASSCASLMLDPP